MLKSAWVLMAVVSVVFVLTVASGCACGHVTLSPAASASLHKAYPGATLGKAKCEVEDGVKVYEVAIKTGEAKSEVTVAEDGVIVETESAVPVKDLPKAVTDAVAAAAPGAKIDEAKKGETLVDPKAGKLATPKVDYEITVVKDGKEGELAVTADGKITEQLKWEKEKERKGDKD